MIKKTSILTPSHIMNEGIKAVLNQMHFPLEINVIHRFEDLSGLEGYDMVLISPDVFLNRQSEFLKLKNESGSTQWIGVLYSHYNHKILDLLDYQINIDDSFTKINTVIEQALHEPKKSQHKETLSDRETDVLKLMVNGLSNKEIADQLFISPHTVITHRKNISQKTGIKSLSGLTIYAVLNDLVNLEDFEG